MTRSRLVSLGVCLAVAAALRIVALDLFTDVGRHGDEVYYVSQASSIAEGQGHPGSWRPPLYPTFLAGVFALFGKDPGAARIAQIVLGLLTVAMVHTIASARRGTTAGLLAGLLCALAPSQVHYGHFLWSEGLLAALVMAFFWAADAWDRRGSLWRLALAGLALGLSALTRETWVHFAFLAAVWAAWPQRGQPGRAVLQAAVLLAPVALVVLPWTVRNQGVQGSFVLISTNRWFPIAAGNVLPEDDWLLAENDMKPYRSKRDRRDSELAQEEYWKGVALEVIAAEQPAWIFKKTARNLLRLTSPKTQPIRFLMEGWLPHPGAGRVRALVLTEVFGNLLVLGLGAAALWLAPLGRTSTLAAAAVLFTLAVHIVANAVPRFLVPLIPLLALHGGALLAGGWRIDTGRRRLRWLWWAAAGLTVILLIVSVAFRWETVVVTALELPRRR